MSQPRAAATALAAMAVLGPVVAGCDSDSTDSRACQSVGADYVPFADDISANKGKWADPPMLLADDLQADEEVVEADVKVHSSAGETKKALTQLQQALQKVVDKAHAGTLDVTPLAGPLRQVNEACGLSLKPPVVPTDTPASGG